MPTFVTNLKGSIEDRHELGEYGHDLSILSSLDINIPNGFIITTDAYFDFVEKNNLVKKVNHLLENFNEKTPSHIIKNIMESEIPQELIEKIFNSYATLGWSEKHVTLFPSPTEKDLKLKTIAHIKGEAVLLQEIKSIWAAFFEEEALLFRHLRNLSHFKTGIAIVVLEDLPVSKQGFIEESKIILNKGDKISQKEENQLLEIEEKVLSHHYFSKRVDWLISNGKIYATNISAIAGRIEPKLPIKKDENPAKSEQKGIGGIATGVIGKEILIEDSIDYKKLKEIRHIKGLILKKEIENPHIRIVLSQMGFPVVVSKENFKNGTIVTVDAKKNRTYQGEFTI